MKSRYRINKLLLLLALVSPIGAAAATQTIRFDKPAEPDLWQTDSLAIGNGTLGALLFGGTNKVFVHFNESSLWLGNENNTGSYQSFGNFVFEFEKPPGALSDYRRELNIADAVHTVSYTGDNVKYRREAFASKPAKVVALFCTADKPGAYSGVVKLHDDHDGKTRAISDDTLEFSGKLGNGTAYVAQLKVVAQGGSLVKNGDTLVAKGVDELRFFLNAGTDYIPEAAKKFHGEDPTPRVVSDLAAAAGGKPGDLRAKHIADHRALFDRVTIDLGPSDPALEKLTTLERLLNFAKTKNDPDLEELAFDFGRYALIASSREGGLPANLQGVWNRSNNPPWRSDYHSDINVDMNYWLAEPANLSDLHRPFFDWVISQLPVNTANTAKHFKTRGWTAQYENGIHGGGSYRWNHSGSSWFAQQFWTHYAFTLDKKFLKEQALPVFRGVCEFWEDWLVEKDGRLIAPQGWSPEHGPNVEDGCSYDQEFAWDAFTNYLDTCKILGVEQEHAAKIEKMRAKLMPLKIGKWGQLQEWLLVDRDREREDHRHLSHLVGVYPGRQIGPSTPGLFAAAKKSLHARSDGGAAWALPWKAAAWARYRDGERARLLLVNKLNPVYSGPKGLTGGSDGTAPNLFGIVWKVFQMDAVYGYTGAMCEMLLQSQEPGALEILPALPFAWNTGSFSGLKARGGHTVSASWEKGELLSATIVKGPGPMPKILFRGVELMLKDERLTVK